MDILQYLIALLKTRKQIGVEGLGTFYKKKTPGRYDAETHSFLPPSYVLEFTNDILENNNLSAYIQDQRGISEDSAKYFIRQFVEEVQKQIQQGEYTLNGIGSFKLVEQQLTFTPSQDINTGFDFFALPAVAAEVKQSQPEENDVVSEDLPKVTDEPHIEQVQVPEFEHEMSKLPATENEIAADVDDVQNEEITGHEEVQEEIVVPEEASDLEQNISDNRKTPVESTEEEQAVTEQAEETNAANGQVKVEEEETATQENESADVEVFEEITEVNTENSTNDSVQKVDENEPETWDFDNENVVSANDIDDKNEPENLEENTFAANIDNDSKNADGIKLNATTKEWDFDNIENKDSKEDNVLIGDFEDNLSQQEISEERRGMPLYQKVTFGLLILVVVFAVLYFVKPDIFDGFKRDTTNPDEKIAVPIERSNLKTQQDSISFADSIMQNAEKAGLDVQPAKDTIKVTTTKSEVKPTFTYDIIIASFATTAKAEDYINRMKRKGFDAKISTMHGKRKNISIATYNNADSAEKYLAKFRKQFNNKEIYAQPIKNK